MVFESFLNQCRQSYEALVPLNFRHQLPCSEIKALVPQNLSKGSNQFKVLKLTFFKGGNLLIEYLNKLSKQ